MPTSGNVLALAPGPDPLHADIGTSSTCSYPYALDEFEGDDPGCSKDRRRTGAPALPHGPLSRRRGGPDSGISGEKIDDLQLPRSPALLQPRSPLGTSCTGSNSTGAATHSPSARSARRRPARGRLGFLTCTSIRTPSCAR